MIVGSWDVEILFSKGWPDRSSPVPCYKEKVLGRSRAFCRSTETGKWRFLRSTSTHEPPPMPPSIHGHHRLPVGFACAVHFRSATLMKTIVIALAWFVGAALQVQSASADRWTTVAPRDEIRPNFQHTETGGESGHGALIIRADEREGLHGWWQKTFTVTGGQHYRFSAWRRTEGVAVPRRSVLARVLWRDEAGREVKRHAGVVTNFSLGVVASAEPEYPRDSVTGKDGWAEMSGIYEAPPGATQGRVELHLLWAANGKVEWSDVAFLQTEAPAPRKVRLASVH